MDHEPKEAFNSEPLGSARECNKKESVANTSKTLAGHMDGGDGKRRYSPVTTNLPLDQQHTTSICGAKIQQNLPRKYSPHLAGRVRKKVTSPIINSSRNTSDIW